MDLGAIRASLSDGNYDRASTLIEHQL